MSIPVQTFIDHVNQSIETALRHQSWLHAETLNVAGFTSGTMQRLFCNLVHLPIPEPAYLECGLWKGKSFCACMNNSPDLHLYGIENGSQPFGEEGVMEELASNIEKFKGDAKSVTFINEDCYKVDLKKIKHPIQVFLFDSEHSYSSQYNALPYYLDVMDNTFAFMVDDNDWQVVNSSTRASLDFLKSEGKIKVEREWILSDGKADGDLWRNGLAIFVCSKIK